MSYLCCMWLILDVCGVLSMLYVVNIRGVWRPIYVVCG